MIRYVLILLVIMGAAYATLYRWASRDNSTVCISIGYDRAETSYPYPFPGHCVTDYPVGVSVHIPADVAYRVYIRRLRLAHKIQGARP